MQCAQKINDILESVTLNSNSLEEQVELWNKGIALLCDLEEECIESLVAIGWNLLDLVDVAQLDIEHKLWVILMALPALDKNSALELSSACFLNKKTQRKESYVDVLNCLEDQGVMPVLMSALESNLLSQELEEWTISKILHGLLCLHANEASHLVMAYASHPVSHIRGSAINFLRVLDVREAFDTFVHQLGQEDDFENFEALVSGIVGWNQPESLSVLRDALSGKNIDDEDFRDLLQESILSLEVTESVN